LSEENARNAMVVVRQSMVDAGRGGSVRNTRVPSSGELTDMVEELKYEDPQVDAEMRKYIEDIVGLITTGN